MDNSDIISAWGGEDLKSKKRIDNDIKRGWKQVIVHFENQVIEQSLCVHDLLEVLKLALEHEHHTEGKCGCGWTLKAESVIKKVEGRIGK